MSRQELIELVGKVIIKIDVLRADFPRTSRERRELDDIRDLLDTAQRQIVRNTIKTNTKAFKEKADELASSNKALNRTLRDVADVADKLEAFRNFLGSLQGLVGLITP